MANELKNDYLKTIFRFKNLINTEFGRGKTHVLSLTDLLIMQGIANNQSSVLIAQDLKLTKAAVSQCVNSLDKKGLIKRNSDPNNRRSLLLELTPDGQASLNATNVEFDAAFANFTDEMGTASLKNLLELMNQMVAIIDEH